MIVEFMGLPGAGKSTLHSGMVAKIQEWGIPDYDGQSQGHGLAGRIRARASRARRLWNYAAALWVHRRTVLLALVHLVRSRRSFEDKLDALRWFLFTPGRYQLAVKEATRGEVALIDEGFMQRAFTLFVDGGGRADVESARRYIRAMPLPDVLVCAIVDPEVALRRLSQRDRWLSKRFMSATPEQLLRMMSNSQRMFDGMLEEVGASQRGVVTLEIDTNNLDTAWKDLEEQLDLLLIPSARRSPLPMAGREDRR